MTHFSDKELACHHCGLNFCTPGLVAALEATRAAVSARRGVDTPLIVDDAYRCAVHNAAVGGAPQSEHMRGIAADVRVDGMSAAELCLIVRDIPGVHGIGRADHQGYVHLDLRPSPARWCYDAKGKAVKWYEPPLSVGHIA